ncbi:MAG: type II secretion system protein [Bdellovibrionota bacterium]
MRSRVFSRSGFALVELVVLLGAIGVATAIVASLFQQVAKVSKRSSLSGTIVDARSKVNAISKNPDPWLNKLRGQYSIFSSCIPNAKATSGSTYSCPQPMDKDTLEQRDPQVAELAGTQLYAISHEIEDSLGERIAGSLDSPVYLDESGRPCTDENASSRCPIKSVGYFLRSNASTSGNPGDVRFVIKVEPNMQAMSEGGRTLFKPEILTIDLGQSWKDQSKPITKDSPLSGALLLGYKLDGTPYYNKPGEKCPSGEFLTGLSDAGTAICQTLPTTCSGKLVLDAKSSGVSCAQESPCSSNEVHVGYYAGTGGSICQGIGVECAADEILTGSSTCVRLPTCSDTEVVSFNGTAFSCAQDVAAQTCPAGQIMVGMNSDKTVRCEEENRDLASDHLDCPAGQVAGGFEKDGTVICHPEISYNGKKCNLSTEVMVGFDANGDIICSPVRRLPRKCKCCYAFYNDRNNHHAGACGHWCYYTLNCQVRRGDTGWSYNDTVGVEGGACGFWTDRNEGYVPGTFSRDCQY